MHVRESEKMMSKKMNLQEAEWFCIRCHRNRTYDIYENSIRKLFMSTVEMHSLRSCYDIILSLAIAVIQFCILTCTVRVYCMRTKVRGIQLEISFGTRWRCLYWVKWGSMWSIWQGNEGREQVKWNKFFTRNQQSLTVECNYSITCTYTYTILFCNRTYQAHTLSPPPTTTTTPLFIQCSTHHPLVPVQIHTMALTHIPTLFRRKSEIYFNDLHCKCIERHPLHPNSQCQAIWWDFHVDGLDWWKGGRDTNDLILTASIELLIWSFKINSDTYTLHTHTHTHVYTLFVLFEFAKVVFFIRC